MECDEEKMRNGEDVWFAKCGGGGAEDIGEEDAKRRKVGCMIVQTQDGSACWRGEGGVEE